MPSPIPPHRGLADLMALVCHEARNLRRVNPALAHSTKYEYLAKLPCGKVQAWKAVQRQRIAMSSAKDVVASEKIMEQSWGVTLEDLHGLFLNPCWDGRQFGGRRWAVITDKVLQVRDALRNGKPSEAARLISQALALRHNGGGTVEQKLQILDVGISK